MVENRGSIVEALAGKRVFLTGVTGFLGQVILERLLLDFPNTSVSVLVRAQASASAIERVHYLTRKPAFDPLRERLGGDDALLRVLDERVQVIDGDFTHGEPPVPSGVDVAIHSAATVSFDPPIDDAFRTNVYGAQNLYRGVIAAGNAPHLVHVSTAYVAGVQKGVIPEGPLEHRVEYAVEAEMAMRARSEVELASRKPEMLEHFMARAAKDHSRAGPSTVSTDAEERRKAWVDARLIEYGRQRARTLGWPDVYTFTKAMGERAVEDLAHEEGLSLSIVRPSIIESALAHPSPGWIDGFKMADPIIRAYGLGQIPEFPGIPEGIVDLIPVDYVVNAILAVAASPPPRGEPAHYNVSSGDRNPLRFFELYEYVREYFEVHPLPERGRGQHKVPTWDFPGNLHVERLLRRAERFTDVAEQVVTHLPKSKTMRDAVARVDRDKARVDFVKRYSDLYGMYTETEVVYTDERVVRLWGELSVEDRERFPFDAGVLDWKHYLQDVHCPAVTRSLRELARRDRERPTVTIRPAEQPTLAVFDMEGTIISSNVVESYVWTRLADLEANEWPAELVSVFGRIPGYLQTDRRDRGDFLRTFFRRYEGADVERLDRLIEGHVAEFMLQKASPAAIRRVREHRAAGHRTVMITAAAEPFVRPLAPLFDVLIGAELEERDGRYTGFMSQPPLVGEARAAWLRRSAQQEGVDLRRSFAYADSYSDLPLLRAVGNPVAVSPDSQLYRYARRRRWPIEAWAMSKGMPKVRFPRPAVR
ncbi:MAG TPA: HAD-IB family hydrolase [Actinomycetota bacterium]|nr:HAD-IB family hydrolase [Actinomycetota bacterium]